MKKIFALCTIFSMCFLTGCTKNYKTVDEYISVMNAIKNKKTSYTIEAKYNMGTVGMYYKTYIKGDKWKTEMSMNGGNSYMQTILYDGIDLLTYVPGSPDAVINPMFDSKNKKEEEQMMINNTNPVYILYDWSNPSNILNMDSNVKPVFVNQKEEKNGFQCRLIKFGNEREACIDDKTGLAVYHKLTMEDPNKKGDMMDFEINMVKVDYTDIPDSTFQLPPGIKKKSMDKMLDDMNKQMEKVNADMEKQMAKLNDNLTDNYDNSEKSDWEDED